jgi:hypothetical protein
VKIKTECGVTECKFADFVAVNPDVEKVREAYRSKKADSDMVTTWSEKNFGEGQRMRDFDKVVGNAIGPAALKIWDEWMSAQPKSMIKRYYNARVVAACIMGEDE